MAREISTPVVLENVNIIPGSEVIRIKGAAIPALIRDADYIIDNAKGEIRFLADGAAIPLSSLIETNGLDIDYSYQIDFSDPSLFESQVEVFDEVATRVTPFTFSVQNSPVVAASRVLNQTTQEEYPVTSIHKNQVTFSGLTAPRTTVLNELPTTLESRTLDKSNLRHLNTYTITYPSKYSPTLNPILTVDQLISTSSQSYLLVIGGEEELPTTIRISVPLETSNVQLSTGGRTLRSSSSLLLLTTDYAFNLTTQLGDTDYKKLVITLGPTAIQKIRTNNLYMRLAFTELPAVKNTNIFNTKTHHLNERLTFIGNEASLVSLPRLVKLGDVADAIVSPTIQVIDRTSLFIFEEGIDYTINIAQKKIVKIPTGRIGSEVLIFYIEERKILATFELVSDVVLIDYIWSNNALNWNKLRKELTITQVLSLKRKAQFITLTNVPLDETQVLIYLQGDFTKTPVAKPISINTITLRLHIEPIPIDGSYVVEYVAISQPIREGTPYYVSYKYGATRNVLKERFARLVGINETQTQREEVAALASGATSTQLSRSITSIESVLIFLEDDAQEAPVSIPTGFDNVTRTLSFTSISSSGRYVFRYLTTGFDTKNLRTAVQKLFDTFSTGPTLAAFQDIISGFVETPPDITSGLTNRFLLASEDHTTGNRISFKPFETPPTLDDGSAAVQFVPARFNLGAVIDRSREGFIKAPAPSNIGLLEGTLEFLTGILFNAEDGLRHYFVDVLGPEPRRNRFSIYKNKNDRLNFDIWDNKGQLFRSSADINQVYNTEILQLTAGATTAVLTFDASPAQLDLDDNQTPDLYSGLETKFIIMPETPTFPVDFRRASIKVLAYDPPTRTITFEPVDFSGRYIFSYVGGLVKFEETENFIAATWKLHTHDGEAPFYRLYINGRRVVDQTLADIEFVAGTSDQSTYDSAEYDIDVYEAPE